MVFALLPFALAGFVLVAGACGELQSLNHRVTQLERNRSAR